MKGVTTDEMLLPYGGARSMMSEFLLWLDSLHATDIALALLPFVVAAIGLARESLVVTAFGMLFGFWMLLSGYFKPFLIAAGVACALAVIVFARRMEVVDREGVPVDLWRAVFGYWPWLIKEIIKSAWQVSCIILHPRLPISPTLVRFAPSQRSHTGLVVHANSITLTPGTITVDVAEGEFLVHALTEAAAQGLAGSEMDRRVSRLEAPR